LEEAARGDPPHMRAFYNGVHQDEAAVRAAISMPWPNGQVEGQVNTLKFLKKQSYGRANLGYGTLKTAYALDLHEAHKQEAFRALEALLEERDALRREWAAPVRLERARPPVRALFGPGEDEVPVYDPGALVL
jgi:hypothetical protein